MQNFDFANATKAIDYAISLFPTDSFFRILRVKKLIMELQIEEAEEELNRIETMFPPSTDLYLEKVMLSRITGSDAHAMDLLNKAYALDPNDPDVHFLMAYEYLMAYEQLNGDIARFEQYYPLGRQMNYDRIPNAYLEARLINWAQHGNQGSQPPVGVSQLMMQRFMEFGKQLSQKGSLESFRGTYWYYYAKRMKMDER